MPRTTALIGSSAATFLVALVVAGVGGCNVHELGHLIVGEAMGIPINDITWCLPANGRIEFAYQEPALVGYAGGFLAAAVLGSAYWFTIRPRLASLVWWTAGLAVLGTTMSQVTVGVWEGTSPLSYGAVQSSGSGLITIIVLPLLVAALIQARIQKPSIG